MKRQIRRGVFETNSSSTHSLTMCSKEEFDKWKNEDILYDYWNEEFVDPQSIVLTDDDKKEVENEYNKRKEKYWKDWEELSDREKKELYLEKIEDKKGYYELKTYNDYFNGYYLDSFVEYYTTKNGEEIVAFGKYEYNG